MEVTDIPDTINGLAVTTMGDWAFGECYSLTSVTIPNSVTSIGEYAFVACSSLTNVTIGNSVTTIGSHPFAACPSLTAITVDASNHVFSSVDVHQALDRFAAEDEAKAE